MGIRFVEVKCPHWDRVSKEQVAFIQVAEEQGVNTKIAEWDSHFLEKKRDESHR